MATITSITRVGSRAWEFDMTGNTAPYTYYLYGKVILITNNDIEIIEDFGATTFVNEPPPVEIFDANDTGTPESVSRPPYAILQWRGVPGSDLYRVEKNTGSWVAQTPVVIEDGSGYFRFDTGAIDDITTSQYRVIAVDENAVESDPIPFDVYIVRNPAPPEVTFTWDDVDTFTIAAI